MKRATDFQTIRSEGGLLPPDLLRRVLDPAAKLDGTREVRPGIEVIGAPWTSKRPLTDPVVPAASGLQPTLGVLRVMVGRGAVDELTPDRDNPAVIQVAEAEKALQDGRYQYLALGDRHSFTPVGQGGADPSQARVARIERLQISVAEILELPIAERIRLVELIWDSIAAVLKEVPVSGELKAELDRRFAEFEENPEGGSPWEEVRQRIVRGKCRTC